MSAKRYALRNFEESPDDRYEVEGRRDAPLRRGQIVALQFLEAGGGAGEIMDVVTLENRNDDVFVGELLSSPSVVELSLGDRIEFGLEHIAEFSKNSVSIGTQNLSHYAEDIALIVADVGSDELRRLRFFPYLQELNLTRTPVADLSFLSEAPGLFLLNIDDTKVSDLTPVGELRELHTLFAANTNVERLDPLTSVTGLRLGFRPFEGC